jgi:hypothetical protein
MTTTEHLSSKSRLLFSLLEKLSLTEQVEVLANTIVLCAVQHMNTGVEDITPENVFTLLIRDRAKSGETLSNALLYQGLVMLDWLNKKNQR